MDKVKEWFRAIVHKGKDNKPIFFVVILFIVLFFTIRSCEASETSLAIGPTFLSGEFSRGGMLAMHERFRGKYDLGLGLTSRQTCQCREGEVSVPVNAFVEARRVVQWKAVEMTMGVTYWQNTTRALGKNLSFGLSIAFNVGPVQARVPHYSNAGSGSPNLGQDAILGGWWFK